MKLTDVTVRYESVGMCPLQVGKREKGREGWGESCSRMLDMLDATLMWHALVGCKRRGVNNMARLCFLCIRNRLLFPLFFCQRRVKPLFSPQDPRAPRADTSFTFYHLRPNSVLFVLLCFSFVFCCPTPCRGGGRYELPTLRNLFFQRESFALSVRFQQVKKNWKPRGERIASKC